MSVFSTDKFEFELYGDGWQERTIHVYYAPEDDKTGFVITRLEPDPDGDNSVEASVAALPEGLYDSREILRSDRRWFGTTEAQDVSFIARNGAEGRYFRVISLPHYGRELSFQWVGHAAARHQVDARAERTVESIRFWSRG